MKYWVKKAEIDRYSHDEKTVWLLGKIVGQRQERRYHGHPSMTQTLSGDLFWNERRFLVEVDDGEVIEAWESEVYKAEEVKL